MISAANLENDEIGPKADKGVETDVGFTGIVSNIRCDLGKIVMIYPGTSLSRIIPLSRSTLTLLGPDLYGILVKEKCCVSRNVISISFSLADRLHTDFMYLFENVSLLIVFLLQRKRDRPRRNLFVLLN